MLSVVFLVATCTLAAALPKPDIIVVDPEPARSDFIAYGQGDTFVDSALKSKMGDEGPGESRAQVLGLLAGEGTFGSKSETVLDLPQGAGTSGAGEYAGINKGFGGGFTGSSDVSSVENQGSRALSNLRGRHRGSGIVGGSSGAKAKEGILIVPV
ncbi:hypothetical protein OTU49_001465 [Cherax quadricarinatus]|uniref:Uncharacterized protein n=1 Tax=Cherax quadricarinatus TaxID=27406 RepID=A0AAW0XTH0_CHEQU|nr:uncharacterized protein LOC128691630 [Cherax quadricarinatus]XP_053636443.1 uncharacterized protein LOC128691630 [Cherax quadricarinatus]